MQVSLNRPITGIEVPKGLLYKSEGYEFLFEVAGGSR